MKREQLYGWGHTSPSVAEVSEPGSEREVSDALITNGSVLARGLGRSYGDAAQLAGGHVLVNRLLTEISPISPEGVITLGAGVSIDELLQLSIPQGWFIPVTPGTRQVTIGGALAADVHGKNHHVDGSIGKHVLGLHLVTPSGAFNISPEEQADLFWATLGGMGLTGVITNATLRLLPIASDQVTVDTLRFNNLDAVMEEMVAHDNDYRYSVAWVDCMTKGASLGRSILTRGDHAPRGASTTLNGPKPPRLKVPFFAPRGLLNQLSIRTFNEAWFRRAPKERSGELQRLSSFFHPLDGVSDWNRLYGKRGFVQYQFVVPDSQSDGVRRAIELLTASGVPSFLAVLKRFGPANPSPLSFPLPGWTLALDMPVGPSALPTTLDKLDDLVLEAGGRIYLAKDSRLDPSKVPAMYPRLGEFQAIKERVDPSGVLASDLSRRLELLKR